MAQNTIACMHIHMYKLEYNNNYIPLFLSVAFIFFSHSYIIIRHRTQFYNSCFYLSRITKYTFYFQHGVISFFSRARFLFTLITSSTSFQLYRTKFSQGSKEKVSPYIFKLNIVFTHNYYHHFHIFIRNFLSIIEIVLLHA